MGKTRNSMEALLLDYRRKGRLIVVIPRFADFYGPNVMNDLYGRMFISVIHGKSSIWPVNADIPHNFTYIEDAAEAKLLVVGESNSYGKIYHVSGEVITARQFAEKVYKTAGSQLNLKILSKEFLRIAGLFNSNALELIKLLYECSDPYILDDSKFKGDFPAFRHTLYDAGIKTWWNGSGLI